jgi:hypothetical protein
VVEIFFPDDLRKIVCKLQTVFLKLSGNKIEKKKKSDGLKKTVYKFTDGFIKTV